MTALEFIAAGVVFERKAGLVEVHGPAGKTDLLERLRAEVARRVDLVVACDRPKPRSDGCCDQCGDMVGHGPGAFCPLCGLVDERGRARCRRQTGGFCDLCAIARQKLELSLDGVHEAAERDAIQWESRGCP